MTQASTAWTWGEEAPISPWKPKPSQSPSVLTTNQRTISQLRDLGLASPVRDLRTGALFVSAALLAGWVIGMPHGQPAFWGWGRSVFPGKSSCTQITSNKGNHTRKCSFPRSYSVVFLVWVGFSLFPQPLKENEYWRISLHATNGTDQVLASPSVQMPEMGYPGLNFFTRLSLYKDPGLSQFPVVIHVWLFHEFQPILLCLPLLQGFCPRAPYWGLL